VNPTPVALAGPDKTVLEGGVVQLTPALNAGFPVTYLWTQPTGLNNPNAPDPLASPVDDITYTMKVTSDKGCTSSDQVFVKVLKTPQIPNVFSPNGDNIHDRWVINFLNHILVAQLKCSTGMVSDLLYGRLYNAMGWHCKWKACTSRYLLLYC
jgi:hypothetical protein